MTGPDGGTTRTSYDRVGSRLAVADPLGRVTTSTYTAANDLDTLTDALGNATRHAYDLMGRPVGRTLPDGGRRTVAYDAAGRKVQETSPPCNRNATCAADPVAYCDAHPADCRTTRFTHDASGSLLSRTDQAGRGYLGHPSSSRGPVVLVVPDAWHGTVGWACPVAGRQARREEMVDVLAPGLGRVRQVEVDDPDGERDLIVSRVATEVRDRAAVSQTSPRTSSHIPAVSAAERAPWRAVGPPLPIMHPAESARLPEQAPTVGQSAQARQPSSC